MASRIFNRRQSLEREVKDIYLDVAIGSSGAPTIRAGYGINSIVRNSAGDYTITLSDTYNSLKYAKAILIAASAADLQVQLISETIANSASRTLRLVLQAGTTATDAASGSRLLVKLELKNVAGF